MILGKSFSKLDSLAPSCPSEECGVGDCFPPYRLPPFDAPRVVDLPSELPPPPALVLRLVDVASRSARITLISSFLFYLMEYNYLDYVVLSNQYLFYPHHLQ